MTTTHRRSHRAVLLAVLAALSFTGLAAQSPVDAEGAISQAETTTSAGAYERCTSRRVCRVDSQGMNRCRKVVTCRTYSQ